MKKFVKPRLEVLEDRCVPSTFTWTGIGPDENWSDNNNWRANGLLTVYYPGERDTSDVVVFQNTSNSCIVDVTPQYLLHALSIPQSGDYRGTITFKASLNVSGGSTGQFLMSSPDATLNMNTLGANLNITDSGTNGWSAGSIIGGEGQINIKAVNLKTTFGISGTPGKLAETITVTGTDQDHQAILDLAGMTNNLSLDSAAQIQINDWGNLELLQINDSPTKDLAGGIVTPSGQSTSGYAVFANGGTVERGSSTNQANGGEILLDRPLSVSHGGTFTVNANNQIKISGKDANGISVFESDNLSNTYIKAQSYGCGVLTTTGNIFVVDGRFTFYPIVGQNFAELYTSLLDISTGATLRLESTGQDINGGIGNVEVFGNVTLESGSYYVTYGSGKYDNIEQLLCEGGTITLGGGLCTIVNTDQTNQTPLGPNLTIMASVGLYPAINGDFAGVSDQWYTYQGSKKTLNGEVDYQITPV